MELLERRFAAVSWRAESGGMVVVEGVAVPYDSEADIGGHFTERILPGAFGDVEKSDVVVNLQHDRGRPLARSGRDGGLSLSDSATELRARVELPATTDGRDAGELLRRGVLRGWSIEFVVNADGERWDNRLRSISRATLRGLALVDRPAYTEAEAQIAKRAVQVSQAQSQGHRRVWL